VRVIKESGPVGVMGAREALELALNSELDLVEIASQAVPPVCKIMDYGKFCFERKKKEKEAKKRQHVTEVKEVKFSVNISDGDMDTKIRHVLKFLSDGNKVKICVRLKGREIRYPKLGFDAIDRFYKKCSDNVEKEKPPVLEGRQVVVIFVKKNVFNVPKIDK